MPIEFLGAHYIPLKLPDEKIPPRPLPLVLLT
jgi:hypothetical protein